MNRVKDLRHHIARRTVTLEFDHVDRTLLVQGNKIDARPMIGKDLTAQQHQGPESRISTSSALPF